MGRLRRLFGGSWLNRAGSDDDEYAEKRAENGNASSSARSRTRLAGKLPFHRTGQMEERSAETYLSGREVSLLLFV
ncbi:hypothetical protein D1872_316320 [compost metagenome]